MPDTQESLNTYEWMPCQTWPTCLSATVCRDAAAPPLLGGGGPGVRAGWWQGRGRGRGEEDCAHHGGSGLHRAPRHRGEAGVPQLKQYRIGLKIW